MQFKGTKDVAKIIGVKPGTLLTAVWSGRIPDPQRGPGNVFLWTDADIDRAKKAFNGRGI